MDTVTRRLQLAGWRNGNSNKHEEHRTLHRWDRDGRGGAALMMWSSIFITPLIVIGVVGVVFIAVGARGASEVEEID